MKKIVCIVISILTSILLLYSICNFIGNLFSNENELIVTSKNRVEINEMIKDFCNDPNKINRIRFKVLLGDGELRLYNYFHLEEKKITSEADKIMYYMCENGTSVTGIYFFEILIELIILLFMKSILDEKE